MAYNPYGCDADHVLFNFRDTLQVTALREHLGNRGEGSEGRVRGASMSGARLKEGLLGFAMECLLISLLRLEQFVTLRSEAPSGQSVQVPVAKIPEKNENDKKHDGLFELDILGRLGVRLCAFSLAVYRTDFCRLCIRT